MRELRAFRSFKVDVVYFGGGTPTLLSSKYIAKILEFITKKSKPKEITFETTVQEFTKEKAEELASLGVNRISFGIQTFDEKKRKFLGRKSGTEEVLRKINIAQEYFIVSIDLLYDLPNGNSLLNDVKTAVELGLDGISIYPLEHTSFTGKYPHPSVEENEREFLLAFNYLLEHGYTHINMNHFTNGRDAFLYSRTFTRPRIPLLGVGPGAGGHIDHYQTFHSPGVKRYLQNPYHVNVFIDDAFEIRKFISSLFEGKLKLHKYSIGDFPLLKCAIEKNWGIIKGKTFTLTPLGVFWANTLAYMMSLDYLRSRMDSLSGIHYTKTDGGEKP